MCHSAPKLRSSLLNVSPTHQAAGRGWHQSKVSQRPGTGGEAPVCSSLHTVTAAGHCQGQTLVLSVKEEGRGWAACQLMLGQAQA
jgi:hypothetical protein